MAFWIFMLIMDLLIPLAMIHFGKKFIANPPKEISALFGYRTTRSMQSQETWDFAHRYIGKLWYRWGIATLLVSCLALLFFIGRDIDTVGAAGAVICFAQLIPMVGAILPTEWALKRNFGNQ